MSCFRSHISPNLCIATFAKKKLGSHASDNSGALLMPMEGGLAVRANQRAINLANYQISFLQIQRNISKSWGWWWWCSSSADNGSSLRFQIDSKEFAYVSQLCQELFRLCHNKQATPKRNNHHMSEHTHVSGLPCFLYCLWHQERKALYRVEICWDSNGYMRCLVQVWPDCFHGIIALLRQAVCPKSESQKSIAHQG